MRPLIKLLLVASLIPWQAYSASVKPSSAFSYTGNFAADDDKREFFFTLSQAGAATIRTWSYAGGTNAAGLSIPAGGFDPTISIFDSNGDTVAVNQDGGCGLVAADATTQSCWDAYLAASLPAGNYRVVLTQSVNAPASGHLADGFYFDGAGNFTQAPTGSAPGFWDFYPNQRTSAFALDILAAASSTAPAITSLPSLPFGVLNASYSPVTLSAIGAPGTAFIWIVAPNSTIPANMMLTSGGVLQGTPATPGSYTFTVEASDGVQTVEQALTFIVYSPVFVPSTALPGGTVSQPYGPIQLGASGGAGAYSWSSAGLPPGLNISQSGIVSGAPTTAGVYSTTCFVTDLVTNLGAFQTFSISIAAPALLISGGGALSEISLGASLSSTFAASGGTPPYTFSAVGALPPGVILNPGTGLLSGTPGQPGNYSFKAQVTDAMSAAVNTPVALSVLGFTTAGLPDGRISTAYSASFAAAGGLAPYSFSATGVPAGLTLATNGTLNGTPTTPGSYSLRITVTDSNSFSTSANFGLSVTGTGSSPLSVPVYSPGSGTVLVSYSDGVTAVGGTPPYSWAITGGAAPHGVNLSAAGALTGNPTVAGSFSFTAQVSDSAKATASGSFTIVIAPARLQLSMGNSLPNGVVGSDYPLQILSPTGGARPYKFSISSGALPGGLGFADGQISGTATVSGTFNFTVTITDAAGKTTSVALAIVIDTAQVDLILGQTFISFSLMTGSPTLPTPASVTVRSSVVQQLIGYSYALSASAPWLSLTSGTTTPGSIAVSLTAEALALAPTDSNYQVSIVVTCAAPASCAGKSQTIAVTLSVTAPPPLLAIDNSLLSFNSTTSTPAPVSSIFAIRNAGGGTLTIVSVTSADNWATVSGTPAAVRSGSSAPVRVTVDPGGLAAGYYRTTITVNSAAGSVALPVSLLVTGTTSLTLNPQGTQFELAAGGALGDPSGSFAVGLSGAAPTTWSAAVLPGAGWLNLIAASGTSSVNSPGIATFALDPVASAALPAGTSYATIRVSSDQAINSPQDFQVAVTVTPPTTPVKPNPVPAGLLFTSNPASTSAATQNVQLFASSAAPVAYQASATTVDGAGWLQVSPATGTTSASSPAQSSVSVNTAGLKPGVYLGGVSYAFSGAAVRTVNISLIVKAAATPSQNPSQNRPQAEISSACAPSQIVATQIGLVSNFAILATLPTPLSALVVDNCGNPMATAQLAVTFSNGDAPLALTAIDTMSGIYTGTWIPLGAGPQVHVLVSATTAGFAAATTGITGEVTADAGPVLTQNAILHVYNPLVGGAVSPGTILQLYGSNLAAQPVNASMVPLTTTLGQTSVTIGGIPAPLYYVSPTQINAQAPYELVVGKQYQVVVHVNGALTAPGSIAIAAADPGIAALPNGQIIAQHLDGSLVSESAPAVPGDYVVFYLAGLGATDVAVATGAAAPAGPLAHPVLPPILTLNSAVQPYQFAGLTPGLAGLYQIDFLVPAGTPDGDLQLIVSQSGTASNAVILPVHK